MKISICIPTYKRVEQLKEAIRSCINQSYVVDEIIIGDDSPDESTKKMIKEEFANHPEIVYNNNRPSLGQADNVNNLFRQAKGEYLILLHDDDLLLTDAVAVFSNYIRSNSDVDAVFGKQILISNSGKPDMSSSEGLNKYFYRSSSFKGNVLSPLESGFLQQFPNDAYLIKTEVARKIGYDKLSGDACDFDFGLRLGKSGAKLHFVDEFTAKYRISNESISNKKVSDLALSTFIAIEQLHVPVESLHYKMKRLNEIAPVAIIDAIRLKRKKMARRLFFSKFHRHKIITLGGIRRFLLLIKIHVSVS